MSKTFLEERSGEFACHYTTLATVCEHILPSKKLRFSPFEKTNDPRETGERKASVLTHSSIDPSLIYRPINKDFNKARLQYSKIFCTTMDSKQAPSRNTERCHGRPRMWAQYGDNHRGMGLVFDRNELAKGIKAWCQSDDTKHWAGEVSYEQWAVDSSKSAYVFPADEQEIEHQVERHIEGYSDSLFFRKVADWRDENEWRGVIFRRKEGYELVPFGSALKAIVMGVDCSEHYSPSLQKLADGIPIFKLNWNTETNDFELKQILGS